MINFDFFKWISLKTYDNKACKLLEEDDYDPGENYYSNEYSIYNEFMSENCYSLCFFFLISYIV